MRQQAAMGRDIWWDRYLTDTGFRIYQEVEAYRAQLRYLKDTVGSKKFDYWHSYIIDCLCGPVYGKMMTRENAVQLLDLSPSSVH